MEFETPLRSLLSPLGLDLYDAEFERGTLNVVVTKPGGVDLESLTKANRTISEWLDANDPIPGRFTLDVSSPGLERRLRTAQHFASAVGEVATLRELRTRCRHNTPREIRIATVYWKPTRNKTTMRPDYYVHETDEWLVFPHEICGLTEAEIRAHKPQASLILRD